MKSMKGWRQGRESNSRIKDLQSSAVPLSHPAVSTYQHNSSNISQNKKGERGSPF